MRAHKALFHIFELGYSEGYCSTYHIFHLAAGGDLYSYMNGGMTQNLQQNGDINAGNGNPAAFIPLAANNLINRYVKELDLLGFNQC